MAELRWNPLLGTYTMVAANRQGRPHLPTDGCPFCPNSGKTPENFTVLAYPNDFPTLAPAPEAPAPAPFPYQNAPAVGRCEVLLYTPEHDKSLWQLPLWHIEELVALWGSRFAELAADPAIQYIYPFENRGVEVGVTIHHPHGQLYAYPFLPLKIETELQNAKRFFEQTGQNLFDAMNRTEKEDGRRMVAENDSFLAYLPHFTDYPYGLFVVSRNLTLRPDWFSSTEIKDLAALLRDITGMFDTLYNKPFPYMMVLHSAPVNLPQYEDCANYYAFHIEFYPPLRTESRIKYYASSEMGAWAAANVRLVEETAAELRNALAEFRKANL